MRLQHCLPEGVGVGKMVIHYDRYRCRGCAIGLEASLDGLIDLPAHGQIDGLSIRTRGARQYYDHQKHVL
jgi:hypothetical protein